MIMKLDEEYFRQEQQKIRSFIETGFFTLSVILIASLAIVYSQKKMPADKSVMSNSLIHNKERRFIALIPKNRLSHCHLTLRGERIAH